MAEQLEEFKLKEEGLRKSLIEFMLNSTMTWQELATELDLSYITILKFCRRKKSISRSTMIKIDLYLRGKHGSNG